MVTARPAQHMARKAAKEQAREIGHVDRVRGEKGRRGQERGGEGSGQAL